MSKLGISSKRLMIDKANATLTLVMAITCFLTVGALISTKALLERRSYQSRVIRDQEKALKQLKTNKESLTKLQESYSAFVGEPTNTIGGLSAGTGERDGDNAKITLDALPSKYDFPALTTSVEKLLTQKNFKIKGLTGSDEEISEQENSRSREVIVMPIGIEVIGGYDGIIDLLTVYERSIRPFQIDEISLKASTNEMNMNLKARTYYLPAKQLNIDSKVIK